MGTSENLKKAFAGESEANQKYLAFAKKAEQEGFPNIAKLFRTTAEAERVHAESHFKSLAGVNSTTDNLKTAIAGETYEYTEMYPPMLEQAKAESHKSRVMFNYAVQAEAIHAKLYSLALEAVQQGKDLAVDSFYLCPICGHIEFGSAPEKCPICGASKEKYCQVQPPCAVVAQS